MDPNICDACGEWSDGPRVAEGPPALVCRACGHRRLFARLPLFALTGPSAAGVRAWVLQRPASAR